MRPAVAALSVALLVPAASRADEGIPSRFTVGLRTEYATAWGSAYADPASGQAISFSDGFRSHVAFQLEGSYRLTGRIAAGAYLSYGFGVVGRAVRATCVAAGVDCSARTIRAGVQGFYALGRIGEVTPWLGLGAGWEWTSYTQEAAPYRRSYALTETFSGPEILGLQAGADLRAVRRASIGAYVQVSLGRFSKVEQGAVGPHGRERVDVDPRVHAWIGGGVRGTIHL